jgi:two-component sensor histidine kinase
VSALGLSGGVHLMLIKTVSVRDLTDDPDELEVVLREFQHRVKNNLQTIISFLVMQRRHASTQEDRDRFVSVMDRVHAIALAQDQLSFESGISNVEFGDYLRALCANIDPQRETVSIASKPSAERCYLWIGRWPPV